MRPETRAYLGLLILRILIAFTSTSTIHPDEHFQNPEIAASGVLDYSGANDALLRTWEWAGEAPCRSIVPVLGSTGAAFLALKTMTGNAPTGWAIFAAQRAVMLLLSFATDWMIWSTCRSSLAVLLFASSAVTTTFLLRPFSNSLETWFFAASIALVFRVSSRPRTRHLALLGGAFTLGIWTRVTFVAFASPLVVAVAILLAKPVDGRAGLLAASSRLIARGLPVALACLITAYCLAFADTLYFRPHLTPVSILLNPSFLVLTPLNLLRYNLSAANLADHGLHPRYLHVLVNWPMLFGAGLAIAFGSGMRLWVQKREEEAKDRRQRFMTKVLLACFAVPTLLLSVQPHQEPRFLVPLIIPLVLLAPQAPFLSLNTAQGKRRRRIFLVLWLTHSALFTLLFGYVHQGGLLPAIFSLNRELRNSASPLVMGETLDIVFWRTFMPPRHLLLPAGDNELPSIRVTDMAGAAPQLLILTLAALPYPGSDPVSSNASRSLLVAPAYAVDTLADEFESFSSTFEATFGDRQLCLNQLFDAQTFGVHVDMDRLGDLWGVEWESVGVGVWTVDCE
ncbi:hypothetical protein JCM1841_001597 [Sporobolomyces salmonicolor]